LSVERHQFHLSSTTAKPYFRVMLSNVIDIVIETYAVLNMSNHMLYLIVHTHTLWSSVKYICFLDLVVANTYTASHLVTSTQFLLTTDSDLR